MSTQRVNDKAEWQQITGGRLYRLNMPDTSELINEPLHSRVTAARYWKVRVAPSGGGLGHRLPTLVGGWLADDLLFVARGSAPFRLLYGNFAATALDVPADSLVGPHSLQPASQQPLGTRPAMIGPPTLLGGESRLVVIRPRFDTKRLVLRSVLILTVGLLGVMVWKLARTLLSSK